MDKSEGTAQTLVTLADLGTSVFSPESERTVTLHRLTNRVERAEEAAAEATAKKVAAEEKAAKDAGTDTSHPC